MRYVVNKQGGAKQVDENVVPSLLSAGYIEITKEQFQAKQYYPEYDNGPQYKSQTTILTQVQTQKSSTKTEREFFETRIV